MVCAKPPSLRTSRIGEVAIGDSLLVRPPIRSDEWFDAFVRRLLDANGVLQPTRADVAATGEWLRQSLGDATVSCRSTEGGGAGLDCGYGVHRLPRRSIRGWLSGRIAACPRCLDEEGHFRLVWMLAGYEVCLRHRVMLQRSCSTCGRSWTGSEVLGRRCARCGTSVSSSRDAAPVSADTQRIAMLVWCDVDEDEGNCGDATGASVLRRATLLHRLIRVASHARFSPDAHPSWTTHAAGWLAAQGSTDEAALTDPAAFVRSLNRDREIRACAQLLRGFLQQEAFEPTVLGKALIGDCLAEADQRMQRERPTETLFPLDVACRRAGVSAVRARRVWLMGKLEAAGSRKLKSGAVELLFDPKLLARRRDIAPVAEAGAPIVATLGISWRCIQAIRRAGLVPPLASRKAIFADATEAARLVDQLEGIALPMPTYGPALVSLASGTFWLGNMWRCVGSLVQDALHGRVPVYRGERGIGFQRLFMEAAVVRTAQSISADLRYADSCVVEQGRLIDDPFVHCAGDRADEVTWRLALSLRRSRLELNSAADATARLDPPAGSATKKRPSGQLALWADAQ